MKSSWFIKDIKDVDYARMVHITQYLCFISPLKMEMVRFGDRLACEHNLGALQVNSFAILAATHLGSGASTECDA